MQVQVETLPNCVAALRVELPAERVERERASILRDFQGAARLPGYRPGKAPRSLIESRYKKEITEELERKLVSAATREAIAEKKLRVLQVGEVKDVRLGRDHSLSFTAQVITAPEFDLPPYKGLPVRVPPDEVTDAEVEQAMENLRSQMADYIDIAGRGLEMGDLGQFDFTGRLDGQPVHEAVPAAPKDLSGREKAWLKLTPQTLLPGFSEALVGAAAGETRAFGLDVPADFPVADLVGRRIEFTVNVRELKQQVLPEFDDEFSAKVAPGKSLVELRTVVRQQLEGERLSAIEGAKRQQIIEQLNAAAAFDLPTDFVRSETRRLMNDIVRQNQERGIADEEIRENEKDIVENAGKAARERLRGAFVLTRIAEAEGIKVTREEMNARINALAARHGMTRDKLLKNLEQRDAFGQIEEELLLAKTLAFLSANASVEVVASGAAAADSPEAEPADPPQPEGPAS